VTIFYGILSAPDDNEDRRFSFANAGHPPPIACHADGAIEEIAGGASMLLGVAALPEGSRTSAIVNLPAGSTLLLYTDGLIEVPGESLTDSIERLKRTVAGGATLSPDALCDRLTGERDEGDQRDDIAILAIRLADPMAVTPQRSPVQAVHRDG
jgi:serine phosphatase RsbU (regulator of sigma subunit)